MIAIPLMRTTLITRRLINVKNDYVNTIQTVTESPYHQLSRIGDWVVANNHQFIAFNKPAGIPSQPDRTGDFSLLNLGEMYAQRQLFLVHRLDRPASGLVIFGKKASTASNLSTQFRDGIVRKRYLAIVSGTPKRAEGRLIHYLRRDGQQRRAKLYEEPFANARRAELGYRLLASSERYHLLEIELITGRFHQVRVQLASMGCHVRGDVKYGARRSKQDRSIDLHAWKLEFDHPVSGERQAFSADPPVDKLWTALTESAFAN